MLTSARLSILILAGTLICGCGPKKDSGRLANGSERWKLIDRSGSGQIRLYISQIAGPHDWPIDPVIRAIRKGAELEDLPSLMELCAKGKSYTLETWGRGVVAVYMRSDLADRNIVQCFQRNARYDFTASRSTFAPYDRRWDGKDVQFEPVSPGDS